MRRLFEASKPAANQASSYGPSRPLLRFATAAVAPVTKYKADGEHVNERETTGTWETPCLPHHGVRVGHTNRKKIARRIGKGESDRIIVLRGRESRPHGEGCDRIAQSAKETSSGENKAGQ